MAPKVVNEEAVDARGLSDSADRLWAFDVKPRKIYVAAPLTHQGDAARLSLELVDAGFIVTSRWVRRDFSTKPGQDNWSEYVNLEVEMGEVDLADLDEADTLVVMAQNPSTSGGYHAELGYFLGNGKTNILVIGKRHNVFFWTQHVRWTRGTDGIVEWLSSDKHGNRPIMPDVVPMLQATFSEVGFIQIPSIQALQGYDDFVNDMWFYEPAKHGGCPELAYTALKMCGEAGEAAEKIGKGYRDNGGVVKDRTALLKELGDQLFYITKLAHLHGATLDDVASLNREKLADRQRRGKLHGEGDDR